MKQNLLFVTVEKHYPKWLLLSMELVLPFEIKLNSQIYSQAAFGYWLSVSIQL